MRQTSLKMVHELARKDPRVLFIGSDLGAGTLADMKKEFPDRFFMEGVCEANIIGMAAGLAMEGYVPYINTIATFLTRRCFEQVAIDLCLHDLPARLIASGGGLVYAPLGPTHLAMEDIAILRALPNMTIVAPVDAEEMVRVMEASLDWPHPMYIRLAKGGDPVVSRAENGFEIGRAIQMAEGSDALIVSTGVMTTRALEAARSLAADGVAAAVLHMHTIKPLDAEALLRLASATRAIVTVEEHLASGGLGTAVLECVSDAGLAKRVLRIGLGDVFPEGYGSQEHLLQSNGLTAARIRDTVLTAIGGRAS
ncbi:transketolase family protein [Roseiterribacter gracilis]|uniref:Transketolase n=1 Tax=Roseiterribacter gracilis TaxID=2812848 RepID=A0A8S8XBS9_9PROT|nr:transketolase [Rhodospirillales bacterium TMPK1]